MRDRLLLLSSVLDHVRVWDIQELLSEANAELQDKEREAFAVHSLASTIPDELYAGVGTGDGGRVVALDCTDGAVLWKGPTAEGRIMALATGSEETGYGLVAAQGGIIHVFDTDTDSIPRSFEISGLIWRISVVHWFGRHLLFATVQNQLKWAVRIWDLRTEQEVKTGRQYNLIGGQEDKTLFGLAVTETGKSLRFAFASKYHKVMVADLNGLDPATRKRPDYREWFLPGGGGEYVTSLAIGQDSGNLFLAAATENGDLVMWNFINGEVKWRYLGAHVGGIPVLYVHKVGKRAVLVSGGDDGILRFWDMEKHEPLAIEIGEPITAVAWAESANLAVGTERGVLMVQFSPRTISTLLG